MMEKKRQRIQRVKTENKVNNMCIFEFQGKDNCSWGPKCRFNHVISEEQRNDANLKEEITSKYERVRGRRKTTALVPTLPNHVQVPVDMVKQLYELVNSVTQNNNRF